MGVFHYPAPKPGDSEAGRSTPASGASADTSEYRLERDAVARLFASGEFHRSPNLGKILHHLCDQYFLGKSQLIKEYSIATEALGRKADFDPKRDAIVRVEMHRLRKRLKEYYGSRGSAETLRIHFPEKSYIPEFEQVPGSHAAAEPGREQAGELLANEAPSNIVKSPMPPQWNWGGREWSVALVLGILVLAGTLYVLNRNPSTLKEAGPAPSAVPVMATASETAAGDWGANLGAGSVAESVAGNVAGTGGGGEIRILAGHPKGRYPDRYGSIWQGDDFFQGGTSLPVQTEVHSRGFDSNLFSNMREGEFSYHIPLKPGNYELLLLFAETSLGQGTAFGGGEASRAFHIHANGKTLAANFDVMADAHDTNAATAKLFKDIGPGKDGKLHLHFQPGSSGKAFVNAIVLRPGVAGHIKPIRMVCRPNSFRDSRNTVWEADHYYRGGVQITRPTGAAIATDPELVKGERYGKFSYTIPVPPGKYQARLYFWEYWFGSEAPGKGGVGSRLFDVFCNFRPLLTNMDLIKRSPQNHYVMETFRGLEPNVDSKLVFEFAPKANHALLNAIEIADDDFVFDKR